MTCFETPIVNHMRLWVLAGSVPGAPGHKYTECISVYGTQVRVSLHAQLKNNIDEFGDATARAMHVAAAKYGQPSVCMRCITSHDGGSPEPVPQVRL
eukprot:jgi/Chlat1/7549/Chrsp63S07051